MWKAVGCRECRNTGYRGRKGIFELLVMTDDIRELVLERASSGKIKNKAVDNGLILLREDGWAKVHSGMTTIEEESEMN